MHALAVQLVAIAHLSFVHAHHAVTAAGFGGAGRFLARRLFLHGLLHSGGWILVLIVVVALFAAAQIGRRRR